MMTKFCPICKQNKPIDSFPNRKNKIDGKDTYCRACNTQKGKEWNISNKDKRHKINKKYADKNREKVLQDMRDWYQGNKEYAKKQVQKRIKEREKTDACFRLARRLRSRLCSAIKGNYKSGSAIDDLGCSVEFLKGYLEALFKPGMSWSNYGEWQIDHIKPLYSFDLIDREQFKQACHYTNLQPLWKVEHLEKSLIDGSHNSKK